MPKGKQNLINNLNYKLKMKTLKEISHDTFYKMEHYHQITIDFVEDTEELFDEKPENNEDKVHLISMLNCLSYNIDNTLEVFNPEFTIEISDLKHLLSLIEIRIGYIETFEFTDQK